MPLPTGTWKANVNGTEAELRIQTPDEQGRLQGQILGSQIIGFWDEVSQTITFTVTEVLFAGNAHTIVASFKGYLFRSPPNPEPGRDVVATLAGSLQMSVNAAIGIPFPAIGTSRRNVFGWFAQIAELQ